jgi:hypothetical protein
MRPLLAVVSLALTTTRQEVVVGGSSGRGGTGRGSSEGVSLSDRFVDAARHARLAEMQDISAAHNVDFDYYNDASVRHEALLR